MKVLVVDDDPDQLVLRTMLLEQTGFETIRAADAGSAADLAAAEKPECAVVDLRLPTEELGLELIRELKRLDPAIHIVVITGGNPERVAREPVADLIEEILQKGGPSGLLISKLKSLAVARSA